MAREFLGGFELLVMLALIRLGDEAYGVPISEAIEECSGRDVAIGSVYITLDRLERKGLVTSRLGEPTPERGGRAKTSLSHYGQGAAGGPPGATDVDRSLERRPAVTRRARMKAVDPPRLATLLMQWFEVPPPMTGDLAERYHHGRSGLWYWRQAVTATWLVVWRDIVIHPVLVARAVLLGAVRAVAALRRCFVFLCAPYPAAWVVESGTGPSNMNSTGSALSGLADWEVWADQSF